MVASVSLDQALLELSYSVISLQDQELRESIEHMKSERERKSLLQKKLAETIRENAKNTAASNGWSTALKIASFVGALFLGAAAIATGVGTTAGICMCVSAGLLLTNQLCSSFELFGKAASYFSWGDEALKSKLEWHFSFWSSLLATGASVASAFVGGLSTVLGTAGRVIEASTAVGAGIAAGGKAIAHYDLKRNEAQLLRLKSSLVEARFERQHHQEFQNECMERRQSWLESTAQVLEAEHQSAQRINRLIRG